MRILSSIIVLCLGMSTLNSQSTEKLLINELRTVNSDTAKVRILHELYDESKHTPDNAQRYAFMALELAKTLEPSEIKSSAYAVYADYLFSQSSYDSAIVNYSQALAISRQIPSAKAESKVLFGLGNCYFKKGSFDEAKKHHVHGLKIAEEINDKEGIAGSLNSLGLIETELGNFSKAMEYFTRSSNLFQEIDNLDHYATTLMSIGMIQRQLGNYQAAERYYLESDSINILLDDPKGRAFVFQNMAIIKKNTGKLEEALAYNQKALQSFESLGDLKKVGEIHYTRGSIALEQNDYESAINSYAKSLAYAEQTNDSTMIAFANTWLGGSYHLNKDFTNAEYYVRKGIEVASRINLDIIEKDGYEFLSDLNKEQGNYEEAYRYRLRYEALKDNLYTRERRELANEIEARYQNEQKQKEIEFLEKEKELQTLQLTKRVNERNAIIAFMIITLFVALLLYNQYRIKQKANKKLKELDRLKSNFFANISHEFRTPLTLIKGPIERLEDNFDEKLSMENVKMIRRSANRVLNMVNQLLDLSKLDEGNLKLSTTEGDIFRCLRAACSSFNSQAAQRGIDYKVQIPQDTLWTSFDRDKLENIIYNLLSNAFKFSESGSLIMFIASYHEGLLQILVSDSGMGIPKEKLPFIFDRFYQVDDSNTREREGSGIGLSLSKDLVELMGGTITVDSTLNIGTEFTIEIPLQEIRTGKELQDIDNTILHKKRKNGVDINIKKEDLRDLPCILMVEDNADMRYFIREQLISSYKVIEATNGEIGFKKSVSLQPDLIITDLMMPKLDGIELCRRLKTNVETSHIPVIMLTAKAGIENKIEGLETGADDYLTKPFDSKELLVRSNNLIKQRKSLRELFSQSEVNIDPRRVTVNSIDQRFLESLIDLLESNFSDPDFGVLQIQENLAMSKTQLHRKVKALTNEPPGELLRNYRLKHAAQLLSQKADSVTQIAYLVGFNNLSYFAKCFKARYGMAPSLYNK